MINTEGFGELMLLPQAVKLYRNKYLHILRHSFFSVLPFLLVVSLLDIIDKNIISPQSPVMSSSGLNIGFLLTGGLIGEAYRQNDLIKMLDSFQTVVKLGYGTVAVIITAELSGRLADLWKTHRVTTITTAVITFFMLSPLSYDETGFVWIYLSGRSFFSAFFAAFFSAWMLKYFYGIKFLRLKELSCFPNPLAERMRDFLPILLTLSASLVLVLALMFLRPAVDDVLFALKAQTFFQSPLFALAFQLLVWSLWWIGIPGFNFTTMIHETAYPPQNFANQIIGANAVFTDGFFTASMVHILGLIIAILLFSRHRAWRRVSCWGLPFMLFNVEELFVFGLPIVLNPIFVIPFLLAPLANTIVGWAAISWGIVPTFQIFIPPTIPFFMNGVLGTHSIMGGVLQIVWLVLDILIYAPFVITANMFTLADEMHEESGDDE